jgi:DNA replicative helicase MCM subunit Mcm2 (Cdc46/Mcm family)
MANAEEILLMHVLTREAKICLEELIKEEDELVLGLATAIAKARNHKMVENVDVNKAIKIRRGER